MPIEEKQIKAWKEEHEKVIEVKFDNTICFIKRPDRQTLGYAMSKAKNDPLALAEVILSSCWLGGDEIIKTDIGYLLGVSGQIDQIIGSKEAEIKNL